MSLVAIVGAGEIGGAAARALAVRARIDRIRLIDESGTAAAGKALDLLQAGPIRGSDTHIDGAADLAAAAGASAIILADPAGAADWSGEAGLGVLRRLEQFGCLEHTVLICADAAHRPLMQQAFDELGLARRRVLGSAPDALAATARSLVAAEARAAATQVALTVVRILGSRLPWSRRLLAATRCLRC
jgi:malate dehydrogenase